MERRILIAGGLVAVFAMCAQASLIYIAIEGTVNGVDDTYGHLESKISVGSTISGYYCYESTTPDSNPSSVVGEYWHDTQPAGIYLNCGGFNFETDIQNVNFLLGVSNNNPLNKDIYWIRSYNNVSLSDGVPVTDMFWQIEDDSMTALSSDALPTTAPDLSEGVWDDNWLDITGGVPCEEEFFISAHVTSAEVVPEPVTILILSLGVVFLRKRKP